MALTKIQQMLQNEEDRVQRQREIIAAQAASQPAPVSSAIPALSAADFAKTLGSKGLDISAALTFLDESGNMTIAEFAESYARELSNLAVGIGKTLNGTF